MKRNKNNTDTNRDTTKRERKWATEVTPSCKDENGNFKPSEPEWFVDENGNEVQLLDNNTDFDLLDHNYPIVARSKYFPVKTKPAITIGEKEKVLPRDRKEPIVVKPSYYSQEEWEKNELFKAQIAKEAKEEAKNANSSNRGSIKGDSSIWKN